MKFEQVKIDSGKLGHMLGMRYSTSWYDNYKEWCIERLGLDKRTVDDILENGVIKTSRIYKVIKRRFPDLFDK